MPYASVRDLPASVHDHLPAHAQEIYRSAFNNAWVEYEDRGPAQREQLAHRVAWAAVKRKYEKAGDFWVPRERLRTRPGDLLARGFHSALARRSRIASDFVSPQARASSMIGNQELGEPRIVP